MISIPMLDLKQQYQDLGESIKDAILKVSQEGNYILGPNVQRLESSLAAYHRTKYGVGVASGTDALTLSLSVLGIGAGDEVIVPAYTFFATAEAVSIVGARPVFVDIDPKTFCIDTSSVERAITSRTRAIIAVHLFGHPADVFNLEKICMKHSLYLIEDNAQATGSEFKGKKTGSFGDTGCLSFYPTKNLGAFGDGGMILTDNDELYAKLKLLRNHGSEDIYIPEGVGWNSRLDEIQAAILSVKLDHLNKWIIKRREISQWYTSLLSHEGVKCPNEPLEGIHSFNQYVIRIKNRNEVKEHLNSLGVASKIYYPLPLHLSPAYKYLGYKDGSLVHSEKASTESLALPIYPELKQEQVEDISKAILAAAKPI